MEAINPCKGMNLTVLGKKKYIYIYIHLNAGTHEPKLVGMKTIPFLLKVNQHAFVPTP